MSAMGGKRTLISNGNSGQAVLTPAECSALASNNCAGCERPFFSLRHPALNAVGVSRNERRFHWTPDPRAFVQQGHVDGCHASPSHRRLMSAMGRKQT